ncbi:hypothetical protein BD410DRAFT_653122 [Rickenella mellea]|uniref:Uncharacterized protein n=1 Tax=Rickenella mellea TaxID=50990 RepID=A0A4Y7PLT0_9AGAM|nr:hypothetical protein BD410DRAFT_653122 [Rickenella mellea]
MSSTSTISHIVLIQNLNYHPFHSKTAHASSSPPFPVFLVSTRCKEQTTDNHIGKLTAVRIWSCYSAVVVRYGKEVDRWMQENDEVEREEECASQGYGMQTFKRMSFLRRTVRLRMTMGWTPYSFSALALLVKVVLAAVASHPSHHFQQPLSTFFHWSLVPFRGPVYGRKTDSGSLKHSNPSSYSTTRL